MLQIGKYNTLKVERFKSVGAFLSYDGGEILLPYKYVPAGLGEGTFLEVFVYTDSEDRLVATTQTPYAVVGEIASLKCIGEMRFGAFLDWGLDKDLFVPRECQKEPMVEGRRYVVYVSLDEVSGRVVGLPRLQHFLADTAIGLSRGEKVELLIWDRSDLGYGAVVNRRFSGLLYNDQMTGPIRIGDQVEGYIQNIRPDGRLDLSMKPQSYDELIAFKPAIVEILEKAGGFLPCNAKSDPALIQEHFGMSKKAFKKLIGALYKERVISVDEKGIRLVAVGGGADKGIG